MRRDRGAQLGQAQHGGILVVTVQDEIRRLGPHVVRPLAVGETLAEVHRVELAGEERHFLENGGGLARKDRVQTAATRLNCGRTCDTIELEHTCAPQSSP